MLFRAPSASLFQDTTLLRVLAIVLIGNSHLERYYPRSWMAADGFIGNSLFFAISGYSLVLAKKRATRGFLSWYARRAIRIYPGLWIAVIASLLVAGSWRQWQPVDYLSAMIWPTHYRFIGLVMVYYILFYPLLGVSRHRVYLLIALALLVPSVVLYVQSIRYLPPGARLTLGNMGWQMRVLYFGFVLFGGWLAQQPPPRTERPVLTSLVLALLMLAYLGAKYAMVVQGHFAHGYGVLYLLIFAIVYCLFRLSWTPVAGTILHRSGIISFLIGAIGAFTLEIYLVQQIVYPIQPVQNAMFPLNVSLFWVITLPCGLLLYLASTWLRHGLPFLLPAQPKPTQAKAERPTSSVGV
jgi:peptidoglycan/LPS O-acetylase OafA/YrhL